MLARVPPTCAMHHAPTRALGHWLTHPPARAHTAHAEQYYREEILNIPYDPDFKWAILGILAAVGIVGLVFGCWVCENIRNTTAHQVRLDSSDQ